MLELLKSLPRFLIETAKGLRKVALYNEAQFLYLHHTRIAQTHYDFSSHHSDQKIIVSLTTYQHRINYIHFVLDSLYSQTMRPSEVRLYVSRGEYTHFPPILEKFKPWLQIIKTEDIKSFKKFIPALQSARSDELIVSLDDDFIYPFHLIYALYSLHLKHSNALIGYCGFKNGFDYFNGIAGGMGILWNPKIFNPQTIPFFFDKKLFWDSFEKSADDMWISLSMLEKKIPIYCISDQYYHSRKEYISLPSEKIDPISATNQGKNYINPKEKLALRKKMKAIIAKSC